MKKKTLSVIIVIFLIVFSFIFVGGNFVLNDKNYDKKVSDETQENNKENYIEEIIDNTTYEYIDEQDEVQKIEDKSEEETKTDTTNSKKEDSKNSESNSTKQENTSKDETLKSKENEEDNKLEKVTLVSSENKSEEEVTTKYGVKIITTTTYKVDTYRDGTIKKEKLNSNQTYDKSTFNATTNDLMAEATSLANKNKKVYQDVWNYVNTYRSEVGIQSLTLNNELSVLATVRAMEMAWTDKFSHTRPDGSSCFTVMDDLSYNAYYYGENVAYGYMNAAKVSEGWKNSPGHYANMINADFGQIGIGMAQIDGGPKYWVQLFTN